MRNCVMEFIGTMFLVLAIGLTGNPLAIGLTLMVMVYCGGHVSGAHYNPAVSLAVWLRGKLSLKELPVYWLAQVAGALAGGAVVIALTGDFAVPAPRGPSLHRAMAVEMLFTFALALVVLNVATAKKLAGNHIYGLAIGMTVTAGAYAGGGISGGAFNPSVYLGPALATALAGLKGLAGGSLFLYLAGPFCGGALAALAFKLTNDD